MAQSTFHQDLNKEKLLYVHLDSVYRKLSINFTRVQDDTLQNQGVDLVITKGQKSFKVDEKAQLDYLNKSLPTFAFEIGYIKNGLHKQGWLFDSAKKTTHYLLVTSIHLKTLNNKLSNSADIKSVTLHWVNRERLISFLSKRGLTKDFCIREENRIRTLNPEKGPINIQLPDIDPKSAYFYYSSQKVESPFNLILKLSLLEKIGQRIWPLTV
jgi:hypothetical protein